MSRYAAVAFCALALAGCALPPCPEGQARDNARQCVAIAASPRQSLDDFDPFPQATPAPSKDAYIEEPAGGIVLSDEAIERINANNRADWERRQAQRAADERADRIVDAQRDTQRAVRELKDELRR